MEAYPLYLEAEELVQEIIDDSQRGYERLCSKESLYSTSRPTRRRLYGGITLVALTLLLSVLSVRTISKRNANIYHNDKLFSIISENVDAVFMVYDRKAQRVEYISENAERIWDLPRKSTKKYGNFPRLF